MNLYPYQKKYVEQLLKCSILGIPLRMGKGKTAIILEVLRIEKKLLKLKGQVALIIAPKNVLYNVWQNESKKFSHDFTFHVLDPKSKKEIPNCDIYLINPEGLLRKNLSLPKCHALIIDESTKFKNYNSKRFKALCKILPSFTRRTILTGTPTPRGLINLWSQIYILDQGARLGKNYFMFRNRYFYQPYFGSYEWKIKEWGSIKILRAVKEIFNHKETTLETHPPPIFNILEREFPPEVRKKYKALKENMMLDRENIEAKNAADLRIKLRQFTSGLIYTEDKKTVPLHDIKEEALIRLIESQLGDPILILYNFSHEHISLSQAIKKKLKIIPPVINGKTSSQEGVSIIFRWNKGKMPVLLAQCSCVAHGLNLQFGGATQAWYSLPEDLEIYEQCNARLNRTGQTREVIIHHCIIKDSIDEVMMNALKRKSNVQKSIMEYLNCS